jgi:hypothetical protein
MGDIQIASLHRNTPEEILSPFTESLLWQTLLLLMNIQITHNPMPAM